MHLSSAEISRLIMTCGLILTSPAFAEDELKFRGNMTWITAYVHLVPDTEFALNPDNSLFLIPENNLVFEIRPNIKLATNTFQLVARPKVVTEVRRTRVDDEYSEATGKSKSTINEAFFNWNASPTLTFAYGRQSYQWGAAESLNPSNRIFHETSQSKNILYEVVGKDIARINFTFGRSFSTVFMTEFQENKDEQAFQYDQEFKSTGLIKTEFSWNNGTDYLGFVGGGREGSRGWVGEYLSQEVPFFAGLFIYGDASHQRGSAVWYPVSGSIDTPGGPQNVIELQQSQIEDDHVYTSSVGGLRFDFENGCIIRAEYIRNDAGYTQEERKTFFLSQSTPNPAQATLAQLNQTKFLHSGLELPGQKYAYTSAHIPDFLTINDLTLFVRGLRSVTDGSASGYASFDYLVGSAGTISASGSGDFGKRETELRSTVKNSYGLAYKHNW